MAGEREYWDIFLRDNNSNAVFGQLERNASRLDGTIGNINKGASQTGSVFGGLLKFNVFSFLAGKATEAAGAMWELGTNMEYTRAAFTTLLGSAEKSDQLVKDIQNFAAATPFETTELVEHSKRLLAYGYSMDEIIPSMKAFGDIAAGVGKDKLPQLITAMGQIRSKGFLKGQEMMQLQETGLPILEALSKVTGHSKKKIAEGVADLHIPFEKVNEALADLTKKGAQFGDLMDIQSKTVGGRWSTIVDNFQLKLIAAFDKASPHILSMFDTFEDSWAYVEGNMGAIEETLRPVLDLMDQIWTSMSDAWSGISEKLGLTGSAGDNIKTIFTAIGTVLEWMKPLLEFAGGMIAHMIKTLGDLVGWLIDAVKWIGNLLGLQTKDFGFKEIKKEEPKKAESLAEYNARMAKNTENLAWLGPGKKSKEAEKEKKESEKSKKAIGATRPTQVIINIGNLVKEFTVSTVNMKESPPMVKRMISEVLVELTNDANRLMQT